MNTEHTKNPIDEFLNSKEPQKWSRWLRWFASYKWKWSNHIEQLITMCVAGGAIWILIIVKDKDLIDKSTFGVMFGTVFGYILSWRFGK